jgi:hypothetical protein
MMSALRVGLGSLLVSALCGLSSSCMQDLSVGISSQLSESVDEPDAARGVDAGSLRDAGTKDAGARDANVSDERDARAEDDDDDDEGDVDDDDDAASERDAGPSASDAGRCASGSATCAVDAGKPDKPAGMCDPAECTIIFLTNECDNGRTRVCWREVAGGSCKATCEVSIFTGPTDDNRSARSDAGEDASP